MKSQAPQSSNAPDVHEALLLNMLDNSHKHANISHDMVQNQTEEVGKLRRENTVLQENQLEVMHNTEQTINEKGDKVAEAIKEISPDLKTVLEGSAWLQKLITLFKGDIGEKGDKGEVGERGEKGETGEKGKDGVDGKNGEQGLPGKDGKNGKDGLDGADGKDADVQIVIKEVLTKIKPEKIDHNAIIKKVKESLRYKDIKDAPEFKMGGTGYLREITDVEVLQEPTNGQTLVWDSTKKKWKAGSAVSTGGGYTVETPTGSLGQTSFTVTAIPVYLSVDNAVLFEGFGYSRVGLVLSLDVPPQNYIYSFHQ